MESRRQARVARQLERDLSEIFLDVAIEGRMVSVSHVKMSPDLGHAKVYLSFLAEPRPQEAVKLIRMQKSRIRGALGQRVRHQLRKVPELDFYYDDTQDYVERMEALFERIRREEAQAQSRSTSSDADASSSSSGDDDTSQPPSENA
jgi:ribosome-binding factor A